MSDFKNILIIDDDHNLVFLWREAFKELADFNAFSIVATIEIEINHVHQYILDRNINYILTDYAMPNFNGGEIARLAMSLGIPPANILCNSGAIQNKEKLEKLGIGFFEKPMRIEKAFEYFNITKV